MLEVLNVLIDMGIDVVVDILQLRIRLTEVGMNRLVGDGTNSECLLRESLRRSVIC